MRMVILGIKIQFSNLLHNYNYYFNGKSLKIRTRNNNDVKLFSNTNKNHYSKLWFSKIIYYSDLSNRYYDVDKNKVIEKINASKVRILYVFLLEFLYLIVLL